MGKLIGRLQDPKRSGVYRTARVDEILDATNSTGIAVARIAFAPKEGLLQNIARSLDFPDWFGGNWDALEDCLTDLSWRDAAGYVLLFEAAKPGDELGVLIDVLRTAAEHWAGRGKPFFAVFVNPERSLALPELFRQA
jgi:RNAse (barnase) inhibitor barstar